ALRKAADAGLVDMTNLVEIWRSPVIPEGPVVLRKTLDERTKLQMTALMASLPSMDPECAYGVLAGDAKGFMPIGHDAYTAIVEARRLKSLKN
ncbi:MAG: phosphonate transport system substrate-binding protein, partial [Paracoccaceae bacterium]